MIVWLTGCPLPSSVIGMVALAASLKAGIVKLHQVERVADFLVHNLGFFFVPAGIGIMNCLDILRHEWWPIVGASVLRGMGELHLDIIIDRLPRTTF